MSIDPNLFNSAGSIPGVVGALSDLDRRVSAMETARTYIGAGTISGGSSGQIVASSITASEISTGTIGASTALIGFLSAGTIETKNIVASSADIDKLHANTIAANTITAGQIAAHTITAGQITAGTITSNEIAAGTITATNIAANTITAAKIAAGTITTNEIAAGTITAANILTGTITAGQIAAGTITSANIAAGTIISTNIAAGTITSTLLASNAVTSAAIVSGAVDATKISVSQLSAISADLGAITAGTVTGATLRTAASGKRVVIDAGGITAYGGTGSTVVLNFDTATGNLALTGTVTANSSSIIPATTIDAAGGGIVSGQIQNGTITGADIAANTIAANNIIAATITATELAASSVTSAKILANTIVAGNIAAGTITATQIQSGSITADRLNVTQLSAIAADLGTITAGTITGATIRTGSGDRVELNSTKLRVTASAVDVITLDPANGLTFQAGATSAAATWNALTWQISGSTYAQIRAYDDSGDRKLTTVVKNAAGVSSAIASMVASSTQSSLAWDAWDPSGGAAFGEIWLNTTTSGSTFTVNVGSGVGSVVTVIAGTHASNLIDASGHMSLGGNVGLGGGPYDFSVYTLHAVKSLPAGVMRGAFLNTSTTAASHSRVIIGVAAASANMDLLYDWGTAFWAHGVSSGDSLKAWRLAYNGIVNTTTDRLVVPTTGGLVVNQTASNDLGLYAKATHASFASQGIQFESTARGDTNAYNAFTFVNTAGQRFVVDGTGQIFSRVASVTAISDARLKTSVKALKGGIEVVRALRPVEFDWNAKASNTGHGYGFVAQEVARVVPHAVTEAPMGSRDGSESYLGLATGELIPYMVTATQQVDQRLTQQQQLFEALLADLANGVPSKHLLTRHRERVQYMVEIQSGDE